MFVDDDVVLGPDCVAILLEALQMRLEFAAFAADYNGEMNGGRGHWDYPGHVGMGATLFRRERLESVVFRWEDKKCECQCCCDDLRRAGYGIGYQPGAVAWHKRGASTGLHPPMPRTEAQAAKSSSVAGSRPRGFRPQAPLEIPPPVFKNPELIGQSRTGDGGRLRSSSRGSTAARENPRPGGRRKAPRQDSSWAQSA